ncbi:hypothetical protein BAC3_02407 [uncultured bacterium]|nr:hypothetical protein BAC3_02407 [uncultured bacterium]
MNLEKEVEKQPLTFKKLAFIGTMFIVIAGLIFYGYKKINLFEEKPSTTLEQTAEQNKELYEKLIETSSPNGLQLPPLNMDHSGWQTINAGASSMLVPPDWKIHEERKYDDDSHNDITVTVVSASGDMYVSLRTYKNLRFSDKDADPKFQQTALSETIFNYKGCVSRFNEKINLGFQPMVLDGAVGYVEIMNMYGKEKNDDGSPTDRFVNWKGLWEENDWIHEVTYEATFVQHRHDELVPLASSILATIKIKRDNTR